MPFVEARVPALDTQGVFTTPEHIAFRFRVAGPMARAFAWLLDALLRVVILFAVAMVAGIFGPGLGLGLLLVTWFLLDWGYGALFEWLNNGATPGKRALGIRVVANDGLPAGPGACAIRNLLRLADGMPLVPVAGAIQLPTFLVGLGCMLVTRDFRRLGDLAAGTLVVYDERAVSRQLPRIADERVAALARELPPDAAQRIDGPALRAITAYVQQRRRFGPARRREIAAHLAGPLRAQLGTSIADDDHFLAALYVACFQNEHEAGGRAAELIRRRSPSWQQLERLLDSRGGGDPAAFARLYRDACADLAIAEAYHLPEQQTGFLHDLVARAHLAFYRRVRVPWRRIVEVVCFEVPARLYGDGCLRIALLAFFGVFALCAGVGYRDPELVSTYLGDGMTERMREMYSVPPEHRKFGEAGAMSGFYIYNNVGIALACFASGIFLGVGSLIYLVYNGVVLGLIFGFMAAERDPIRGHFFEFVSAHGPFELFGIALAGAAGMRLGLGLVAREGRPFAEAVAHAGRRAFPIIAVAATFVALAAPIEGFISPSSAGLGFKRLVMWTCLVLVIAYLGVLGPLGRRLLGGREALREERL